VTRVVSWSRLLEVNVLLYIIISLAFLVAILGVWMIFNPNILILRAFLFALFLTMSVHIVALIIASKVNVINILSVSIVALGILLTYIRSKKIK
jgi:hypothetical protein